MNLSTTAVDKYGTHFYRSYSEDDDDDVVVGDNTVMTVLESSPSEDNETGFGNGDGDNSSTKDYMSSDEEEVRPVGVVARKGQAGFQSVLWCATSAPTSCSPPARPPVDDSETDTASECEDEDTDKHNNNSSMNAQDNDDEDMEGGGHNNAHNTPSELLPAMRWTSQSQSCSPINDLPSSSRLLSSSYQQPSSTYLPATTTTTISTLLKPQPPYPNYFQVWSISDVPEVVLDRFNLAAFPDQSLELQFFLSKCTVDVLADFFSEKFFHALYYSRWKVYMPELVAGFVSYVMSTERDPWTHEPVSHFRYLTFDFLVSINKFVVLNKETPTEVSLSQSTILNSDLISLQVVNGHYGLLTQVLSFSLMKKTFKTILSCHVGTLVSQDLLIGGRYPTDPTDKGFPIYSTVRPTNHDLEEEAKYLTYQNWVQKLGQIEATGFSYQITFAGVLDKLTDLWYLKHFSDEFESKIHVSKKYLDFVKASLPPQFSDCFVASTPTPKNKVRLTSSDEGDSDDVIGVEGEKQQQWYKFHYQCPCVLDPNDMNEEVEDEGRPKIYEVRIWSKTYGIPHGVLTPKDFSLLFIHDLV